MKGKKADPKKLRRETLQQYHVRLIKEGIRDAEAGNLIPHEHVVEVVRAFCKKRS